MEQYQDKIKLLKREIVKLHARYELAGTVTPDYYEPGMMEYLDQSDGSLDAENGIVELRFESKGTRYGDRTELIETLHAGDSIIVVRDPENRYNANNFILKTAEGKDVGNMPAELCDALAPLYDAGELEILSSEVSFVDPISKRSRYAKQAMLFVYLKCAVKEV